MPDLAAVEKIAAATDLPITFHKAIDDTVDILTAIDHIAQSNLVQFVLSSGGSPTAQQGQGRLIEMRDRLVGHSTKLIAAGSITATNLSELHRALGLEHYHGKRIVA